MELILKMHAFHLPGVLLKLLLILFYPLKVPEHLHAEHVSTLSSARSTPNSNIENDL